MERLSWIDPGKKILSHDFTGLAFSQLFFLDILVLLIYYTVLLDHLQKLSGDDAWIRSKNRLSCKQACRQNHNGPRSMHTFMAGSGGKHVTLIVGTEHPALFIITILTLTNFCFHIWQQWDFFRKAANKNTSRRSLGIMIWDLCVVNTL